MKKQNIKKLLRLGLQKAGLELRGDSDLRYHFSVRLENFRSIGELLYDEIASGRTQKEVISEASNFLKQNFPGVQGFSVTSIWRMISTYCKYKDDPELEKLSREIPVSQNVVIATMCKTREERRVVLENAVYNRL